MVSFDFLDSTREIVLKLRRDIEDPISRLTQDTENFAGDGVETTFELTSDLVGGLHTIKHIETLEVDSVLQIPWVDYNYFVDDTDAGKIIFINPPADLSDIEVVYQKGTASWVYPDFPPETLKITSYPRIATDIIGGNSNVAGLNADSYESNFLVEIVVFSPSKREIENLMTELWKYFQDNGQTFVNFRFIKPVSVTPYLPAPHRVDQIFQRGLNLEISLQEEK